MAETDHELPFLDLPLIVKWAERVYALASRFPWIHNQLQKVLYRAKLGSIWDFHEVANLLHGFASNGLNKAAVTILGDRGHIGRLCDALRDTLTPLVPCRQAELHCALKVHQPGSALNIGEVQTLGRSNGSQSHRWRDFYPENPYRTVDNSAFAAILGISDGKTNWTSPCSCFCCQDLSHPSYVNRRKHSEYLADYRSTLVFPLNYPFVDETLGFLTFDTPHSKGFPGLPDIYKCDTLSSEGRAAYYKLLQASVAYHSASTFALLLSLTLGPMLRTPSERAQG